MDPDWHIYWVNPGDSGVATTMDWTLPKGFRVSNTSWPTPKRFEDGGLVNYGYEGSATVLVTIEPPAGGLAWKEAKLGVKVRWLVCKEQCVPGSASLSTIARPSKGPYTSIAGWPVRLSMSDSLAEEFERAVQALPRYDAKLMASATKVKTGFLLSFAAPVGRTWKDAYFCCPKQGIIDPGAAQKLSWWRNGGLHGTLALEKSKSLLKPLDALEGVIVLESLQNKKVSFLVKAPIRG